MGRKYDFDGFDVPVVNVSVLPCLLLASNTLMLHNIIAGLISSSFPEEIFPSCVTQSMSLSVVSIFRRM